MTLQDKVFASIRNVPDFPEPGIQFKDITTLLAKPQLVRELIESWAKFYKVREIDVLVGLESRGFLFGVALAAELNVPFVPIRKVGKLPHNTVSCKYDLEYGSAEVEIHTDALKSGDRVLIHDDLLATGGTARAAYELCTKCGAEVTDFCFLLEIGDLKGREKLNTLNVAIDSVLIY